MEFSGFQLYNLQNDPLELNDLALKTIKSKDAQFYMQLQNEIQTFIIEELSKGFQYPVTGPLKGTVIKRILRKMTEQEKVELYNSTGRVMVKFEFNLKRFLNHIEHFY